MDLDAMKRSLSENASLRSAAASPEVKRLAARLDGAALERAVKSGDSAAMEAALRQVLSTSEGKALASRLRKAVGGHG